MFILNELIYVRRLLGFVFAFNLNFIGFIISFQCSLETKSYLVEQACKLQATLVRNYESLTY